MATITIGKLTVPVQCYDMRDNTRDATMPDLAAERPLPVGEWPYGTDELQRRVGETYKASNCRETVADVAWCVTKQDDGRYYFRVLNPTLDREQRREFARGELS